MASKAECIKVAGGVYIERCVHPHWNELFGSGGRAASALASLGIPVDLHTCIGKDDGEILRQKADLEGFSVKPSPIPETIRFDYFYDLSAPHISGCGKAEPARFDVEGDCIVRFGMIEASPRVSGNMVVYDPQDMESPEPFGVNGSTAKRLAIILNRHESSRLSRLDNASPEEMAEKLATDQNAEVVVIKMGPLGALLYHNGTHVLVPAYRTESVWTVGSGDVFVAHFASRWFANPGNPADAVRQASVAASYYCYTKGFPSEDQLGRYSPETVHASDAYENGDRPRVYLAGPFFTLAQRWLVDQTRGHLLSMGLKVFSPVHDVGLGRAEDVVHKDIEGIRECDMMFAIADGLDAGTIFEIGYARSLGKPVIVYCENEKEEDRKMMEGSGCRICKEYSTAIYQASWEAAEL